METRLPAPCLVVLIGPSASGKSSWAQEHFGVHEVVSSDALRATVGAGEDDQTASQDAFDLLERIVAMRITRGLTTVIDTLGFDASRRATWIEAAHSTGMPIYAVLFDTGPELCETRNAARARPVPRQVLRRQFSRFRVVQQEVEEEAFDSLLHEQPVAVVSPQFVTPTQDFTEATRPTTHTFGLLLSRFNWPGGADERASQLREIAQRAESAGFTDLWVMDHFRQIPSVGRPWEDMMESYTTLSFLAGVTTSIGLGALVTAVTYRNPGHLGKIVATLDVLSGGRARCGLGLGWDAEEHAGYGWDFPSTSERYQILEDTLRILPLVWGKGTPEFAGEHISARNLACYPRPIQKRIPILVGGSGERRTLRLAAQYADACNVFGPPDRVRHKVDVLEGHCRDLGRDPAAIAVTHLVTVLTADDRVSLRARVEELRGRNQSADDFVKRNNAGTIEDQVALFTAYATAGASHSIVAIPDVHLDGSIESFGHVIANLGTT